MSSDHDHLVSKVQKGLTAPERATWASHYPRGTYAGFTVLQSGAIPWMMMTGAMGVLLVEWLPCTEFHLITVAALPVLLLPDAPSLLTPESTGEWRHLELQI